MWDPYIYLRTYVKRLLLDTTKRFSLVFITHVPCVPHGSDGGSLEGPLISPFLLWQIIASKPANLIQARRVHKDIVDDMFGP